jgi:glutamate carboxypeptidase
MTELLRELVEIESPTGDEDGIVRAAIIVLEHLDELGAGITVHEGGHLEAELDGEGDPLLVLGHLDTVWPRGTLEAMPWRVEDGLAFGPGAYDMKAGVVAVLAALQQARPGRRPVRLFLGADEETGSVGSRPLIERAAAGVAAALVAEPCLPGGGVKTARKGLGKFRVGVRGIAAHAGANPQDGASAIDELARQVLRLHALTDEEHGITVNVGLVQGGTARNVVAPEAAALVDVRIVHAEDAERVEAAIRGLRPELDGTEVRVEGGWTRPPLEPDESTARLVERARAHARELGLGELREGRSGGGSDGNLVGALDVPVLDGLGPDGGGAHAEDEHVLLASIPQRAALIARLLEDPGV